MTNRGKVIIGLIIAVLVGGFWNGIFTHILLTTGYDVSSEAHIVLIVYNVTCKTFSTIPNMQQSVSLCNQTLSELNSFVAFSDFLSTVLPIISLMVAVASLIKEKSLNLIIPILILVLIFSLLLNYFGYGVGFSLMGGNSNIPSNTTITSTISSTTTSSTTTSTSTSTSTTTILPYTGCPTEPSVANYIPLKCDNLAPVAPNSISFNFTLGQNASTIYNIYLACTTYIQRPPHNQFYPLQSNGMLDINRNLIGTSLSPGQIIRVEGLPCNSSTVEPFEGYIWVNYTRAQGPSVQLNPWESNITFDVYINFILNSFVYNQTRNMS